jgi:hypothetical protein
MAGEEVVVPLRFVIVCLLHAYSHVNLVNRTDFISSSPSLPLFLVIVPFRCV